MDDTIFNVGDAVSFDVGSSRRTTTVLSMNKTRIVCADPHGAAEREVVFTRRAGGYYVVRGRDHGTLSHGGETWIDNDR